MDNLDADVDVNTAPEIIREIIKIEAKHNTGFYFGVLLLDALTSSRLLQEPSLATTQCVYFIFYIF
jgi:hypothetical protein